MMVFFVPKHYVMKAYMIYGSELPVRYLRHSLETLAWTGQKEFCD